MPGRTTCLSWRNFTFQYKQRCQLNNVKHKVGQLLIIYQTCPEKVFNNELKEQPVQSLVDCIGCSNVVNTSLIYFFNALLSASTSSVVKVV